MTRRDRSLVTAFAAAGLALSLWQCWYAYLPPERAAGVHWCRLNAKIDCFESLSRYGAWLRLGPVAVFPALAAVLAFQTLLAAFAWVTTEERRGAFVGLARVAAFPAAGLALFVLLHDYRVAKHTSASAIALGILTLALCVDTAIAGLKGVAWRHGACGGIGLALAATGFGGFVQGAGEARREIERVIRERESAPPNIRYADFAHHVPRLGAAAVGRAAASSELLLFLDPTQAASRAVMRDAIDLLPGYGNRVYTYVYATGEHGTRLLLAHRAGTAAWNRYLADLTDAGGDADDVAAIVKRQREAIERLGLRAFPAAIWGRDRTQRREGPFRLADVLALAASGR